MSVQEAVRKSKARKSPHAKPSYTIRKNRDTTRPYRLYNATAGQTGQELRWRYYQSQRNAEWGVLKEMKWLPVGTVIEVIDVRNEQLLVAYQHVVENGKHGIQFIDY